jgi:hypothetical protein
MIDAKVDTVVETEPTETPQVLTVSQILTDLDKGLDRKAIREKYSLTIDEVKHLFQHPTLKGKRPKRAHKAIRFTLVDDTTSKVQDNTSENDTEYTNFEILD